MVEIPFENQVVIETERLQLLEMRPQHIHQLFESKSKAEILLFLGIEEDAYDFYLQMHEKGMETFRITHLFFILKDKKTGLTVGECGFHTINPTHRRAELFYGLRKEEFKRQGFMKEALAAVLKFGFETINLHRIQALIEKNNLPSLKLLQHFGFSFEGTIREDYVVDGVNDDSDCYSLLVSEWENK